MGMTVSFREESGARTNHQRKTLGALRTIPSAQPCEMVYPQSHPIDDRAGHLPFEPFTLREWAVTILLALLCFGLPVGLVLHHERNMAQLEALALHPAGRVVHE